MEISLWQQRFDEYLLVRNFSPRSRQGYVAVVGRFLSYLTEQGVTSLANLTRTHLESYRTHLFYVQYRGHNLNIATQTNQLSNVLQFIRFLVQLDYLLIDISAGFELPRTKQQLPRVILSERETLRLLESAPIETPLGIRDRAIIEVFYGTAIRNSELCQLTFNELDFERHLLRVEHGKGDKSRVVPMGEEAEAWLQEYLKKVRPQLLRDAHNCKVFLTHRGAGFDRGALAKLTLRLAKRAGLQKHVTPHTLRHSCATHMLRHGADLRYIQAMLGHSSPETTQIYTRVEVSDLRKVILRCHPRERTPSVED